jgi:hypothetical protein
MSATSSALVLSPLRSPDYRQFQVGTEAFCQDFVVRELIAIGTDLTLVALCVSLFF